MVLILEPVHLLIVQLQLMEVLYTFRLQVQLNQRGAIYLDVAAGKEQNFDLSGAGFSDDNFATHGKSLFINAQGDLRIAVPENQGVKIGAGLESYEEFNLDNLMGYD
ncbi:MAG: hypothetical protein EZS28_027852 [Streblomastix strix]|uniref:Uncharacterized protein n=1 Tax=Streblomastix strix TaxID=222440 RepID=A0A5J4V2M4_9EUKA|nr:MAG: hypothetical protein EZS28_027852 [Streblomastix strix]